ncbi:MAG: hypothetical protein AAF791_03630 [Bacteroidota bacterium]
MRALLLFVLLALVPAAYAQVGLDFTVGPVVTWSEDVSGFLFDPDDPTFDPSDPATFEQFTQADLQPSVGFEAGLGLIVMPKDVGLRLGVHYLNTSAVFDEQGRSFDREAFDANFLTLQADLRYGKRFGPVRAYAFGGPEFRFLLDLSDSDITLEGIRENASLLSSAAQFGAGLTFDFAGTKIGPKVSYALDLTGSDAGDFVLDNGTSVRLDEAYDLDTLLFGLVLGGQ